MTLKIGDRIPPITLHTMNGGLPTPVDMAGFCKGRRVALFGVPGAFTPTCSAQHLPSFRDNAAALKARGVDAIACVAVNDVFVLNAWAQATKAGEDIVMLADGSGRFAKATGLVLDLMDKGLGIRNQRFSALIEDGVVRVLNVEEPGAYAVSGAERLLEQI